MPEDRTGIQTADGAWGAWVRHGNLMLRATHATRQGIVHYEFKPASGRVVRRSKLPKVDKIDRSELD